MYRTSSLLTEYSDYFFFRLLIKLRNVLDIMSISGQLRNWPTLGIIVKTNFSAAKTFCIGHMSMLVICWITT